MSDLSVSLYRAITEADERREVNSWHASSIAKCPRSLFLERKQIEPLPDNRPKAGKILRWASGHALEASIRPHLETIYPKLLTNLRFTNAELDLTGEFDGYDPESKTLISVKSVHDYAMITRNGQVGLKEKKLGTDMNGKAVYELKRGPYTHHEWQEHAYALLLSHPATLDADESVGYIVPVEVERIAYVYITLGGLIATYTTPVKPEILKRVKDKLTYLNDCWKNNSLPMCLCQEGQEMYQVQDQYCPYRSGAGCCSASLLQKQEVAA